MIVTIGHNRDYIRVLLYSYYTTITGWGVLLTCMHHACAVTKEEGAWSLKFKQGLDNPDIIYILYNP